MGIYPAFWMQGDENVPKEIVEFNDNLFGEEIFIRYESSKYKYSNPVITIISTNTPLTMPTWDYDVVL